MRRFRPRHYCSPACLRRGCSRTKSRCRGVDAGHVVIHFPAFGLDGIEYGRHVRAHAAQNYRRVVELVQSGACHAPSV